MRRWRPGRLALGVLAVLLLRFAGTVAAHPLAPGLLELREGGSGRYDVLWRLPRARPPGSAPSPRLPPHCRPTTPTATHEAVSHTERRWTVDCGERGVIDSAIEVAGLEAPVTVVVRVTFEDGYATDGIVTADQPSFTVAGAPSRLAVMASYLRLGLTHIVTGPDHLLFVLGLVLLASTWRRIAVTVTAFTLGHSVTLALAATGLVAVPARPIELAIALSVLWVAIEVTRSSIATLPARRPWLLAGGFGLLHGLGFASALREAGLPRGALVTALLAFNVGIELGQLAFVLFLLGLFMLVRPFVASFPGWATRVPVYAMGTLAAYWCWVRAATWLGV